MRNESTQVWNACGYVRLSREDGDKEESNSVTGQKELIRDYFSCHPELRECGMKVDDGFTGSNFERPQFQEMIAEVKAGKVNCIVVKDLSRFGRDHLRAGEYIERIFPFLGVRFIAINDHYDSLHRNPESDELMIPFKNLINEAYCRDTSVKVRSQLEIKRQRGDFIGAFAAFGYQKDPRDHHRLMEDTFAADVVRDIFQLKLNGVSSQDIANRLTEEGVPTPLDYKKQQGMKYSTPFQMNGNGKWDAKMVLRILQNPIYIGTLEQGRVTTPSYKVKRLITKPREEWAVVENSHEAIIDRWDFETVQRVLALDTHTSAAGQAVDKYSGLVCCGECGASMVRKTIPSGKHRYTYYVCSAHKIHKSCFSHSIRDAVLDEIVLELLQQHISDVIGLSDLLSLTDTITLQIASFRKLQDRLKQKEEQIDHYQMLLRSLYESLADGVIDRTEYADLKKNYTLRRQEEEIKANVLREQIDREATSFAGNDWMEQIRKHKNITELDRAAVVTMVERILIFREHRVEIVFRWENEYRAQLELVSQARQLFPEEEVV